MGTSIEVVDGKAETFKDNDLIAVICLMEDEFDSAPSLYAGVEPVLVAWRTERDTHGPGTFDLKLDYWKQQSEVRSALRALLGAVEKRVHILGGVIPGATMNRRVPPSLIVFKASVPGASVVATALRLRELLLGQ